MGGHAHAIYSAGSSEHNRIGSGGMLGTYMAIQELYDACETLFSINTDAHFFPLFIMHHSKDNRWNVEVVKERVNDFHLFSCRPHDIYSAGPCEHEYS